MLAMAVGQLASRLNGPPSSRAGSLPQGGLVPGDRTQVAGHKLFVNIAHRAGYCRELDSHKGFAA
ncbi:hypothetical protein EGM97_24535 [Pseudomonas sp. AF32]|nr:hypothetical protein [Pseudomonas sp. AF32]